MIRSDALPIDKAGCRRPIRVPATRRPGSRGLLRLPRRRLKGGGQTAAGLAERAISMHSSLQMRAEARQSINETNRVFDPALRERRVNRRVEFTEVANRPRPARSAVAPAPPDGSV